MRNHLFRIYSNLIFQKRHAIIIIKKCKKVAGDEKNKEITVLEQEIHISKDDYFSLTDIARYKKIPKTLPML